MKRMTGLIICIFLLFIMGACSTKQPGTSPEPANTMAPTVMPINPSELSEDYITITDTTLETEHFTFRFGSNVYVPRHTEQ